MDNWKYGQYIRNGLRHQKQQRLCQDSVFFAEDDNCVVAALCDGIGSLPESGLAAKIAAIATCMILQKCAGIDFRVHASNPNGMLKDLLEQVDSYVAAKFRERGIDRESGDSTLAFVYISKKFGYGFAASLGDSAVCLIQKNGNMCLTESNAHSESTATINMRTPWEYAKSDVFELNDDNFLGAVLSSDGMDGVLFAKNSIQVYKNTEFYFNAVQTDDFEKTIASKLDPMIEQYSDFLDDDISIAVLSRATEDIEFPEDPTWLCTCGARNALDDTYCSVCGSDFMDVYRNVPFERFGGKTQFFMYANSRPEYERNVIKPKPAAKPAEQPRANPAEKPADRPSAKPRAVSSEPMSDKQWKNILTSAAQADGKVKQGTRVIKGVKGKPDEKVRWWQKRSLLVAGATTLAVSVTVVALHKRNGKLPDTNHK